MKKKKHHHIIFLCVIGIIISFFIAFVYFKQTPTLTFSPTTITQGDPFIVHVSGISNLSSIKEISFDTATSSPFLYQHTVSALFGVDLHKQPGSYPLVVTLTNGKTLTDTVTVLKRDEITAPLGIPADLGGNTTASDNAMVAALNDENKTLEHIQTATSALWTEKFTLPLSYIFVTDPYGYSRQTGVYSIPHKGVDYRAAIGTPVMAINAGIVRVVANYEDYGNTIVVDHGLGVMSFYLHLSKINVKVGDTVTRGQIIGLSGQTGYALGPHLHLSIRINGVSIDPVKFFTLFP